MSHGEAFTTPLPHFKNSQPNGPFTSTAAVKLPASAGVFSQQMKRRGLFGYHSGDNSELSY
jgi:hypothetical protein